MPVDFPVLNFIPLLPPIVVIVTAISVMLLDLFLEEKSVLGYVSLCGLIGAFAPCFYLLGTTPTPLFQNMATGDGYATVFHLIFLVTGILSVLIALSYLEGRGMQQGEYYILLLLSICGMMMMAAATDLIIVFLGLEIMSIALYIMAAFNRRQLGSGEAGLKYFLLGAFASAFFLYGVAFIYGATGSTNLNVIAEQLGQLDGASNAPIALVGLALLMVGFAFKIAAVPFQWWTPDVYQGAPTAATAFMSVGAKAAGFAALVRLLTVSFSDVFVSNWQLMAAILAVITMAGGNIAALAQKDVKRMLAYSSIAHAGYLLVGVVAIAASGDVAVAGVSGILFYLMSYTFMNIGAFAVVGVLEHREKVGSSFTDYAGLLSRSPMVAVAMMLFMFGLTGIPPFIGFWGKLYIFSAAVEAGFAWLAVFAMLNSAISAFYYLGVVVQMFMKSADETTAAQPINLTAPVGVAIGVASFVTILFGLWPTPLFYLTTLGLFG